MATARVHGRVASLHLCALLDAAQRGDWRAVDELLRRYEPLIRAVAVRVRLPYGCERDELAQEARLGVFDAIRAWQPDRGPFGAFAASLRSRARDPRARPGRRPEAPAAQPRHLA